MQDRPTTSVIIAAAAIAALVAGCGKPRAASPSPRQALAALGPQLQAVIDAAPLQMYFHVERLPGRAPLRILLNDVVKPEPPLEKFGVAVLYQPAAALRNLPYIEIKSLTSSGEETVVVFEYPVEGIKGTATLRADGSRWRAVKVDLVET